MAKSCSIEGCAKPLIARGWCGMHYRRWRLYGDPHLTKEPKPPTPPEVRFWPKVKKGDGCWEWLAMTDRGGYGRFWFEGKQRGAHCVAWILANGPIPEGLCVLHRCDSPPCVRPDHLFLGTFGDNARDRDAKGRSRGWKHSPEALAKMSAAQRGRPMNHRTDCECKVCQGRGGRICSVPGCGAQHIARGWCHKHYKRWQTHGDPLGLDQQEAH